MTITTAVIKAEEVAARHVKTARSFADLLDIVSKEITAVDRQAKTGVLLGCNRVWSKHRRRR